MYSINYYATRLRILACGIALICTGVQADDADSPVPETDFRNEIRPLLSDHCFACHGPDEHDRQADVRLDTAEGIDDVVDAEHWNDSLILERIRSNDPDMVMPPADYHKPLDAHSIALLEAWIKSGAEFEAHWAFVAPQRTDGGSVAESADVAPTDKSTRIDYWINKAIVEKGLSPNGPADRNALARRVALDLTGLPPTWADVQSFVHDKSPAAYETFVDRLLQSPAYGEHMGRYWLDIVRYADTHGMHFDNYREMWPYRDWVINAFNDNKPFDEFITEQLAGDLLPDATLEQQIASGFNRLNVTTNEGGSIYAEVFARNVIDRTDAFGTVFLALTTGCAVCHDHKFDPIAQKDYFALSAFFNSLDARALDGNKKDHAPVISVPSEQQSEELTEVRAEIARLNDQLQGPIEEVDTAQRQWQRSLATPPQRVIQDMTPVHASSRQGSVVAINGDDVVVSEPSAKDVIEILLPIPSGKWQALELHAVTDKEHPRVGTAVNGNAVLSEITVQRRVPGSDTWTDVAIQSGSASFQQDSSSFAIEKAFDGEIHNNDGWGVGGQQRTGPRFAEFRFAEPLLAVDPPPSAADAPPGPANTVHRSANTENDDQAQPTEELRIQLSYLTKHTHHLLRSVRFRLLKTSAEDAAWQRIQLGDVHTAGPFPIEGSDAGYREKIAGELQSKFDHQSPIRYQDNDYQWQLRDDVTPVLINRLGHADGTSSVTVMHQTLNSVVNQSVNLLVDSDEGHVVYFNGKKVGSKPTADKFEPLKRSYSLDLVEGDNHLFIRTIHAHDKDQPEGDEQDGADSRESKLVYAFQSRHVELPSQVLDELHALADVPLDQQQPDQASALQAFYRSTYCDVPAWIALQDMRNGVLKYEKELIGKIPTTLIWKETAQPREAFILQRGQYDDPGEKVSRETPGFLPPMDSSAPRNRLGLARWLTSPENPLTSRVAVNRFWQQLFGTGLVKTSEDFGSQGEPPSHPELLDELAIDFRDSGWDVKTLMKRLVMTDAYRRDNRAAPKMLEVDPTNRLLARGPRFRLDAEVLRDQMLAVSELLVDQQGGPSVKPPQPAGLWAAVGYTSSNTATFVADEGEKIHRRSVYTFWKRTSAPAVMSTFDAPSRESCTARRERTNTPLQALLLLNEPQTLEASKQLAINTLAAQDDKHQRLQHLFESVTLRKASPTEMATLTDLVADLTAYYASNPDESIALVHAKDSNLAAWTIVANTLLNLDEVVSK
ncbi:PSD1 and planctomycete cytochrome C domain-containing protein [Neorhodopirellula lusitana]|uniref:PSD1 and planctomycete cytochrome C domain-containing protein n=1 Tax=Neorhodopirellula lusitana TaxID=445327 RepID=UPI00384D21CC